MKAITVSIFVILVLLFSLNAFAEEICMYEAGKDSILDECLSVSYDQISKLAFKWKDEEQVLDLYNQELADSYNEDDIKTPHSVYVLYPTDSFDSLYLFKQAGVNTEAVDESAIAWQVIWNVSMPNWLGESGLEVEYLSQILSLLDCTNIVGFRDSCFVAYQLSEESPCFITAFHAMDDESVIVYTTATWVGNNSVMSNVATLVYNLRMKYGPEAFSIINATEYFKGND